MFSWSFAAVRPKMKTAPVSVVGFLDIDTLHACVNRVLPLLYLGANWLFPCSPSDYREELTRQNWQLSFLSLWNPIPSEPVSQKAERQSGDPYKGSELVLFACGQTHVCEVVLHCRPTQLQSYPWQAIDKAAVPQCFSAFSSPSLVSLLLEAITQSRCSVKISTGYYGY